MADVPTDIPAVSRKAQSLIIRIKEVEGIVRNVEKAVQDANTLLKVDRSWDSMGHTWVKTFTDGIEELKKVLRKDLEELQEEYRKDIEALKAAVVEIKTGMQEMEKEMEKKMDEKIEEKMGPMQKIIDRHVAAAGNTTTGQQDELSGGNTMAENPGKQLVDATDPGKMETRSTKRKIAASAGVDDKVEGVEQAEEVTTEVPKKKLKLTLKAKGDFIISISRWDAKKKGFTHCFDRKTNASKFTGTPAMIEFVGQQMRYSKPVVKTPNAKTMFRLQTLIDLEASTYYAASRSVPEWLRSVTEMAGTKTPVLRAYVYSESASKDAEPVAKAA